MPRNPSISIPCLISAAVTGKIDTAHGRA